MKNKKVMYAIIGIIVLIAIIVIIAIISNKPMPIEKPTLNDSLVAKTIQE